MPKVIFERGDDGVLAAMRETRVFRYLLADGNTIDVRSSRDDSDVRDAVVERMSSDIVGVADVTPQRASPEPPAAAKRQPKRGGSR